MVYSMEYATSTERNINGHYNHNNLLHHHHHHHHHSHHQQHRLGKANQLGDVEWEPSAVNGRAKHRPSASAASVSAPTQSAAVEKREGGKLDHRRSARPTSEHVNGSSGVVAVATAGQEQQVPPGNNLRQRQQPSVMEAERERAGGVGRSGIPTPRTSHSKSAKHVHRSTAGQKQPERHVKGMTTSSGACYVGASGLTVHPDAGSVYGVYSETKYMFAVNGLPTNPAQASAAAAFFAR